MIEEFKDEDQIARISTHTNSGMNRHLINLYDDIIKKHHNKRTGGGYWLNHCIHSVFHPTEGTIYYNPINHTIGKTLREVKTTNG